MSTALFLAAVATCTLAACGSTGLDNVEAAASPEAAANSSRQEAQELAVDRNSDRPKSSTVATPKPSTVPRRQVPQPKDPRTGKPITPSPWQPPAEVDPPHVSPGDSVDPIVPPTTAAPRPSS